MSQQRGFVLLPVVLTMLLVAMIAYSLNHENGLNAALHTRQADMDRARYAAEAGLQAVNNRVESEDCAGYPSSGSPTTNSNFGGATYSAYANPTSGSPVTLVSTGAYNGSTITLTRNPVYAYPNPSSTEHYTLQPNGTAGIDTYLVRNSTTNFGGASGMIVSGSNHFPLIKFNLSAFPPGSIPSSLYMQVRSQGWGELGAELYRMQQAWVEGGANWLTTDGTTSWGNAGGSFHGTMIAENSSTSYDNWVTLNITELGFAWMSGRYPNNGVRLVSSNSFGWGTLVFSDDSDNSKRPRLVFDYWLPCGASGP